MEHKFTIEVILRYDGPNETPKPKQVQTLQIDPNVVKALLPQLSQVLNQLQPKPQEKPKNSDDKK